MTNQQNQDLELEKVRNTVQQLSEIIDPIGLREYIIQRTPRGKSSNPDPWGFTREAVAKYSDAADADRVIQLFEGVGCSNELEAVRWMLKNDKHIP
jgi:hypothetical protein